MKFVKLRRKHDNSNAYYSLITVNRLFSRADNKEPGWPQALYCPLAFAINTSTVLLGWSSSHYIHGFPVETILTLLILDLLPEVSYATIKY